jgi:hypothetical protein
MHDDTRMREGITVAAFVSSQIKLVLECTTEAHRHPTIEDYLLALRANIDLHPQIRVGLRGAVVPVE